jgi:hypothetical protein
MRRPLTAQEIEDGAKAARKLLVADKPASKPRRTRRQYLRIMSEAQTENLIHRVNAELIRHHKAPLFIDGKRTKETELERLQRKHAEYLRSINFGQPNQLTKQNTCHDPIHEIVPN